MKIIISFFLLLTLTACASSANVTLIDRATGDIGRGTIDVSQYSGTMEIPIQGEVFSGPWAVMRTGTDTSYVATWGNQVGSITPTQTGAAGVGQSTMHAPSGRVIRCEFQYSIVGYVSVSSLGSCLSNDGHSYDFSAD